MALPMKSSDFDFADALRDDLAQIYYQQGRYSEAITQLDSILAGPRYKENARVRGMESLRQEIMSQRALCLARNGKYNEAYEIMQSILGYFKQHRDDKRRAEALRKTAKILMLKYDGTGIYNPQALQYYKEYLALSKSSLIRILSACQLPKENSIGWQSNLLPQTVIVWKAGMQVFSMM